MSVQGYAADVRRYTTRAVRQPRGRVLAWTLPLWLIGVGYVQTLPSEISGAAQAAVLLLPVVLGLYLYNSNFIIGRSFRQSPWLLGLTGLFLGLAVVGSILAEDPLVSVMSTFGIALGLMACSGIWNVPRDKIAKSLAQFAVVSTCWTCGCYVFLPQTTNRFDALMTPNSWGLLCFGQCVCGLLIKSKTLRIPILIINGYLIMAAQSRSSMVALVIAAVIYIVMESWAMLKRGKVSGALIAFALPVALTFVVLLSPTVQRKAREAFLLDDRYRGMGSGFSGRTEQWQVAVDLIEDHPVLGIGTRMQPRVFLAEFSVLGVHNGFLGMLVENGIVGGTLFFLLLAAWVVRMARSLNPAEPLSRAAACLVGGYLFICCFEPRLLNIGNPTSLLFIIFLSRPTEQTAGPRARERFARSQFRTRTQIQTRRPALPRERCLAP